MCRSSPTFPLGLDGPPEVEALGVAAEDPSLRLGGVPGEVVAGKAKGAMVAAGEEADGSVTAIHQTVFAEGPRYDIQVRGEVFRLPPGAIRFGDHAGDLAHHLRRLGQLTELFAPGGERALLDEWLGDVIEP